jgi:hypothetical protein
MTTLERGIAIGQIRPRRTRSQNPQDAIENRSIRLAWPTFAISSRCRSNDEWVDHCPLLVGQIHYCLLRYTCLDAVYHL